MVVSEKTMAKTTKLYPSPTILQKMMPPPTPTILTEMLTCQWPLKVHRRKQGLPRTFNKLCHSVYNYQSCNDINYV